FGYFFIRLWQGALDRFRSHISGAPLKNTIVENKVAGMAKGPRLTTTAHLGLQIVLSLIGGVGWFCHTYCALFPKTPDASNYIWSGIPVACWLGIVHSKINYVVVTCKMPEMFGTGILQWQQADHFCLSRL
ncbi:MAG: hypothetical protein RL595_1747, partial [Planctomycetota bacterium]